MQQEFYMRLLKMSPIGKTLVFYFYAKYFDGYRDLNSLNKSQYVDLMILMKRALQIRGDIYLPQLISGFINGRINARSIHNAKLLEKIQTSEAFEKLVSDKYSALKGMGKSDIIINLLSALINTEFLYCDYDVQEKLGKPIEINFDALCQEFLNFVNQI